MSSYGHYGPDGKGHSLEEIRAERSAMFCEHANENPAQCRCDKTCYCKSHTCRPRENPHVYRCEEKHPDKPHECCSQVWEENCRLTEAIRKHRDQKADDRCWMDDLELYSILGEAVPVDNSVGDKFAMLKNCARFIEQRCTEGIWPTYAQLEKRISNLADALRTLLSANKRSRGSEGYSIAWTDMHAGIKAEQNARTVLDEQV